MKKNIILFLFFVFCQGAMAQNLKEVFEASSKEDLKVLKTVVIVKPEQEQLILDFFYKKYKQYSIGSLTLIQKNEIALGYEQELKGFLNPAEAVILDKNKKTLKRLTSE
ncbi:hypothetical protein NTJ12_001599 [Flavobacterium psychrophilum]|nr:hypothetical protein [Flavobacterium psychrophilum]